jgi:hypothetical protein
LFTPRRGVLRVPSHDCQHREQTWRRLQDEEVSCMQLLRLCTVNSLPNELLQALTHVSAKPQEKQLNVR